MAQAAGSSSFLVDLTQSINQSINLFALFLHTINYMHECIVHVSIDRGGSRGRVQGVRTPPPPPEMNGFLIQLVFCEKKNYVVYWC